MSDALSPRDPAHEVRIGADVLTGLEDELDELLRAVGAPITARRPWLEAWLRCHPGREPRALLVRAPDGALDAAALLVLRRGRMLTEVQALGAGLSDQVRLPARDAHAAERLARAVAAELGALRGPWHLCVRHLPPADPVALALARSLPCAVLERGDPSPALTFGAERSLRAHVSKNHHQQVRRMLNRLQGDGLVPALAYLRTPAELEPLLPELEALCIRRDVELRGTSLFERPHARAFLRAVILAHAARDEVELTTLTLGGRLAAYVLCFRDGAAYRMWNCRLEPEFARYGVGRVANNAALERALADPHAREFDWMRGDEPYKLSMSSHVTHAVDLFAWSTPALRVVLDSPRRLKRLVKSVAAEHPWLQPALSASRRLKSAHRRRRRAAALARLR
jgi:CelD/BcsL family acetyltransferase involved in cellulose biosynthesis